MADARWLDAEEQRAWRTFINVRTRLMARLDAELQAQGMTLPDYEVLVHLSEAPDHSLRMAELAEQLLLSPSGLTRRLDGLVRDGLVQRRACPSDRRGSLAALTAKGWERLKEVAPIHVDGVRAYVVDQLSREEFLGMAATLRRIGDALDAVSRPCHESVENDRQRVAK